jgi:hypothetical protein
MNTVVDSKISEESIFSTLKLLWTLKEWNSDLSLALAYRLWVAVKLWDTRTQVTQNLITQVKKKSIFKHTYIPSDHIHK